MKTLLDLARFYNQPDAHEWLMMAMPVLVEAARLDAAAIKGDYLQTAMTDYDVDLFTSAPQLVFPRPMRIVIAPSEQAVYFTAEPTALLGDPLEGTVKAVQFFRPGVGMGYRSWALASWEDGSDEITVLAALTDSPLTPTVVKVTDVEETTDAAIITRSVCYIRVDATMQ